ncbi:MAG TPA: ABC transporter substrate-binding protein [Candidatus Binatia bacterium]|jgi:ABC-type nitrate/sulfonate/bicarbonate transport system substrate-binding protein
MRNRPAGAEWLLGVALVLLACFSLPRQLDAADSPSLRGVYNALGGTMTPAWIAQDLGLFTKHGLQHSLNYLAATTAIQAIVGGTEDIGLVGNQGIDVALEGADTVYIANTASRFIFQLYGDPAIKTVADLKGKVLAATQPAASTDYCGRMLLRKYGLVPDKDVRILYAGSSPALLNALKSGNAAAGLMNPPATFRAQELGLKHILNVTDLNIPFIFVSVVTTRKIIQQKPDAVLRYLRAYSEAISVIRRDKETTLKVMGRYMKTDNQKILAAVYEEHLPVFQRVPLMTKEAVQAVLDVAKNPRAQQVKPEDFYDNSFIQKLDASGFINSLYAR